MTKSFLQFLQDGMLVAGFTVYFFRTVGSVGCFKLVRASFVHPVRSVTSNGIHAFPMPELVGIAYRKTATVPAIWACLGKLDTKTLAKYNFWINNTKILPAMRTCEYILSVLLTICSMPGFVPSVSLCNRCFFGQRKMLLRHCFIVRPRRYARRKKFPIFLVMNHVSLDFFYKMPIFLRRVLPIKNAVLFFAKTATPKYIC